jgi:hypothetical protein
LVIKLVIEEFSACIEARDIPAITNQKKEIAKPLHRKLMMHNNGLSRCVREPSCRSNPQQAAGHPHPKHLGRLAKMQEVIGVVRVLQ